MQRRPGPRLTAIAVVLALLAGGCAAPNEPAADQPSPSAATTSPAASSSTSRTPTPTASSKPSPVESRSIQRVPPVEPDGFVDPPAGQGLQRYLDQDVSWRSCGNLECADVSVPMSWAKPNAQAITLKLGRVRATAEPRLGTLFVNPGGPGGSGVTLAANFARTGLEQYDIVGWDPRGSGGSTPVVCTDDAGQDALHAIDFSPDDAAEDKALREANRAFGRQCLARSGALLQHISTLDTVKDLEFLRQLLGDRKLNYLGYSYGTEIGAVYANAYPRTVGRMVLDSAVNITDDTSVTQAMGFERALEAFGDWCANRLTCGLGRSQADVLAAVADVLTDLDGTPLRVGQRELTQSLGANGVFELLYSDASAYPYLASSLRDARRGDGAKLLDAADAYAQRNDDGSYQPFFASYLAISCTEDTGGVTAARQRAAQAVKDAPTIGPFFGVDYVCPEWPVAAAPPLPSLTAKGAAPIMVIGTTGDSATPYEYARSMAQQLDSGVLLTLDGPGHGAYGGNDCINQAVRSYLTAGRVPTIGTTCR